MRQKLIKILQGASYKADENLAPNLWRALIARDRRVTRIKLWAFSFLGFFSLTGLVPVLKILSSDLTKSGFYEYFSLIFSNGGSIISYWKDLLFSLAESLPIMSMVLSLSLMFIFFLSIKYAIRQIIRNQLMFR